MTNATAQPQLVLLEEWASAYFLPTPSLHTLRALARTGRIQPPAVKVGKAYYVRPDAQVIDPSRRLTLVERLQSA